jgi:hypothetical protein
MGGRGFRTLEAYVTEERTLEAYVTEEGTEERTLTLCELCAKH